MKASVAAMQSKSALEAIGKRLDAIEERLGKIEENQRITLEAVSGYPKRKGQSAPDEIPTGRIAKKAPEGAEQKE